MVRADGKKLKIKTISFHGGTKTLPGITSEGKVLISAYKDFTKSPFCILHRVSIIRGKNMKSSKIKTIAGRILFFIASCASYSLCRFLASFGYGLTTDGFGLTKLGHPDMLHERGDSEQLRIRLSYPLRQQSSRWRREAFLHF